MFKTNVGGIDRILRIVAGLVLIALAVTGTIGLWGWIGVVLLATGLLSTCPVYSVVGLSTCPAKTAKQ
jgi:O-antigen ligase